MFNAKTVIRIAAALLIIGAVVYFERMRSVRPDDLAIVPNQGEIPIEVVVENEVKTGPGSSTEQSGASQASAAPSLAERLKLKMGKFERAKEISTPDGFINLPEGKTAITLTELIGKKVILVDFWTYSCINCKRTTPYLNAWYEKYKDQGFEIVGIHTPEFEFERQYDNVLEATKKENIKYPVVLDNDYSTWTSYRNRFWPRKYLIDIDGFIVFDHIGEGAYEETEREIQSALAERSLVLGLEEMAQTDVARPKLADVPSGGPVSPETYFGAARNSNLGNGLVGFEGEQKFLAPDAPLVNKLYLAGTWNFTPEYAENAAAPARIIFRYQAKNVYFVASAENPVRVKVLRDGKTIGAASGEDAKNGYLTIQKDGLYKVVNESTKSEHTLELLIESPGLRAFTFTFG
jgi:thiol-disulfide isomerase/thioredoxin